MTNLTFNLDKNDKISLSRQLINHLKDAILSSHLKRGDKLPSSRALALDLNVSRIITIAAYEQLIAEGYLIAKAGSGTFISINIPENIVVKNNGYTGPKWFKPDLKRNNANKNIEPIEYDFSIGQASSHPLPKDSWKRAWRKALDSSLNEKRNYSNGLPILRNEIAAYLKRARNIKCHADNIIITSGAAETLRLLAKAMAQYRPVTYAEYPGFKIAWHWLGDNISPVNIDENGLVFNELPLKTNRPTMLFCTPSHQFPLGFRLSLKRRNQILKWAQNNDALILEDDYDSEFHYDTMALPTLKSQDETGQVLYFSSFSKSISPNIKIGYLVAPDDLCDVIKNIIEEEHAAPPYLIQNALANFMAEGALDKHIARSRRHYGKLNKIMVEGLSDLARDVKIFGLDSGIHGFLSFDKFPHKLIKSLEEKSFFLPHKTNMDEWHGFALGYGHFQEDHLKEALKILNAEIKIDRS